VTLELASITSKILTYVAATCNV